MQGGLYRIRVDYTVFIHGGLHGADYTVSSSALIYRNEATDFHSPTIVNFDQHQQLIKLTRKLLTTSPA